MCSVYLIRLITHFRLSLQYFYILSPSLLHGPYFYVYVFVGCESLFTNNPLHLMLITMVVMPFVFWPLHVIYYEFQLYAMLYRICLRDIDSDPVENE